MGGTATRWAVQDAAGALIASGQAAGASAVPDPATRAAYGAVLRQIAQTVLAAHSGMLRGAVLGATGAGMDPDRGLIDATAAALGVPETSMTVLNDMVLAWHAAYPQGNPSKRGHLVAAGTGSVGMSLDASGAITLVGGRGVLIDDAGSGAWIGLRALDTVWRLIDMHGEPRGAEGLARHLFAAIGGADWSDTLRYVYAGDRGQIARLAPAVAAAADDADPTAHALLTSAGQELARLAQALIVRCGMAPIGLTGGVFHLHPEILGAMRVALPGVELTPLTLDAAAHAAEMARQQHPLEDR